MSPSYWEARTLAQSLGALPGTRWFFNRRPLTAFLIALALSPGVLWLNDVLIVWGRVLPLSYQWLAAECDALVAVALGVLLWILRSIDFRDLPRPFRRLLQRRWFHIVIVALWLGFSAQHALSESNASSVSTAARHFGPNGIYHIFVLVPFLGYTSTLLLATAVAHACKVMNWEGTLMVVNLAIIVPVIIAGVWVWAGGVYDANHQKAPNGVSKHFYANPPDPWCGGVITVYICGPAKR